MSTQLIIMAVALLSAGPSPAADEPPAHAGNPAHPYAVAAARTTPADAPRQSSLTRPLLGCLTSPAPLELRCFQGVPGAAVISDPLPLPEGVTRIHLAPKAAYAFLERAGQPLGIGSLSSLESGSDAATETLLRSADLVAFSPSGHRAALLSMEAGQLQVISGLPDSPHIEQELSRSSLPESLTGLAIADLPGLVLVSSEHSVLQLLPEGLCLPLLRVHGRSLLAFLPRSATAAIADQAGTVQLLDLNTGASRTILQDFGLNSLGALSPGEDGQSLYVTDPENQRILSLSVQTGEIKVFDFPFRLNRLDELINANGFLISAAPGRPCWIWFRVGGEMRTVFVPAAGVSARSGTQSR